MGPNQSPGVSWRGWVSGLRQDNGRWSLPFCSIKRRGGGGLPSARFRAGERGGFLEGAALKLNSLCQELMDCLQRA